MDIAPDPSAARRVVTVAVSTTTTVFTAVLQVHARATTVRVVAALYILASSFPKDLTAWTWGAALGSSCFRRSPPTCKYGWAGEACAHF